MSDEGMRYRVVKHESGHMAIHQVCRGSRGMLVSTQPVALQALNLLALQELASIALLTAASNEAVLDLTGASPGTYWWLVKDTP